MKLLKVSVPNFRNLQNVELTFEPDLSPAVFPIASQNGGGKSTFLQLIFTLLHCSKNPDKHQFIQNIIKTDRRYLLNSLNEYYQALFETTNSLPNLYLYNYLTVKELTEAINKSLRKDNLEAVDNLDFSYGSNFRNLIIDFHNFLGDDMYLLPNKKFDSIVIKKQISETERIELESEDLSHGELRRLGLYAWIKYNIPENSIILIDEVENALYPDWQYNIADELASWGDNQYLLATHSFHLCEALTPKHVKEIEPKMSKPVSEAVD